MDLDEIYHVLKGAHIRAQSIVDTVRDPLLVLNADLTVSSANPAFFSMFETDRAATIGRRLDELGNGQWNIDELTNLLTQVLSRSTSVFDYEVTSKFPGIGNRKMLVSAQKLLHPGSGQRLMLVSMVDVTAQGQREDQQQILIGELNHRIKNLLAVTASMARQTKVEGRTAAEFREVFLGRYAALARSLEITALERTADLPDLARIVMKPFEASAHQVSINDGPKVDLPARHAAPLGMILHELATNAIKYGALSVPGGHVSINWEIEEKEAPTRSVNLVWKETNGPKVIAPTSTGFGTRMIKFSAQKELSGDVHLDYHAYGFVAKLCFPKLD